MAKFGLCSIVEASQLDFHKVLIYQDKLIEDRKQQMEQ